MPDLTAKAIDATGNAVDKVAHWTPTGVMQVFSMVLLAALLAVFAALLWMAQSREERRDRETREALQSHTREANAREELRRVDCSAEREKDRAERDRDRERERAFQREENAKQLAAMTAAIERAIKAKGQP